VYAPLFFINLILMIYWVKLTLALHHDTFVYWYASLLNTNINIAIIIIHLLFMDLFVCLFIAVIISTCTHAHTSTHPEIKNDNNIHTNNFFALTKTGLTSNNSARQAATLFLGRKLAPPIEHLQGQIEIRAPQAAKRPAPDPEKQGARGAAKLSANGLVGSEVMVLRDLAAAPNP